MARKVYPNAGVIHRFAQGQGYEARSANGNISCESDVLYSYSTPIAAICPGAPDGRRVAVITTESHSVTTTGKHMPYSCDFGPDFVVIYARYFPRGDIITRGMYRAASVNPGRDYHNESGDDYARRFVAAQHAANLALKREAFVTACDRIARDLRYASPDRIAEVANDADSYCDAFGLPREAWAGNASVAAALADANAKVRALRERRASPEYARKREAAAALRERVAQAREDMKQRAYRVAQRMKDSGYVESWPSLWQFERDLRDAKSLSAIRATARVAAKELRRAKTDAKTARLRLAARKAERAAEIARVIAEHPDADAALAVWIEAPVIVACGDVEGLARSMRSGLHGASPDTAHPMQAGHFESAFDMLRGHGRIAHPAYPVLAHAILDAEGRDHHDDSRFAERVRAAARDVIVRHEAAKRAAQEMIAAERAAQRERAAQKAREQQAALLAQYPDADAARNAWIASGDAQGFALWPDARTYDDGSDVIRANHATRELVTARGASAPLRAARAAFRFIAARREAGALPYLANGSANTPHAGGFALHSISREGAARFGCHVFAWATMARLAAELDAMDAAPVAQDCA